MSFLSVEKLTHIYGAGAPGSKAAIKDISFSLDKGEILGIIGHTGSGKSTLVTHLNGLMKPTSGTIKIDGTDIWENPKEIKKIRSLVGLVFQYPEYQLFDETVFDDIAYGPKNLGVDGDELKQRVYSAAKLVCIQDELLTKSPFDLSGGEKRRVAIAGVLAMEPSIVVFDEPTAGLDPIGRETVFRAIYNYKQKHNATVIIVSHSMEDIAAFSDKVLVLNNGEAVMFAETRAVFGNADVLNTLGLGVPAITAVFDMIKKQISDMKDCPLTVDEAITSITTFLKHGGNDNA